MPCGAYLILFHGSIDTAVLLLGIVIKACKPCRAFAHKILSKHGGKSNEQVF